jgi:hypothetical protein
MADQLKKWSRERNPESIPSLYPEREKTAL